MSEIIQEISPHICNIYIFITVLGLNFNHMVTGEYLSNKVLQWISLLWKSGKNLSKKKSYNATV